MIGKALRLGVLGSVAVAAALALSVARRSLPGPAHRPAYTCTGGEIPSGNYASITVTGVCGIQPGAVINVVGNINVAAGAVLDAQSAPSTITVGHNVTAAAGSLLGMGCQPSNFIGRFAGVPCAVDPDGHTVITVHGNVTATDANTVLLRQLTIGGNVTLTGGGGEIPWSIKGNTIGRNLTISGVTAEWLGVQFNRDRRQRDPDQHHRDRPGASRRDRRGRRKHGWTEPQLHGTGARRVRRLHPRRGQPRRRQGDRSVRSAGLISFTPSVRRPRS